MEMEKRLAETTAPPGHAPQSLPPAAAKALQARRAARLRSGDERELLLPRPGRCAQCSVCARRRAAQVR
jgi:hypothetical protein